MTKIQGLQSLTHLIDAVAALFITWKGNAIRTCGKIKSSLHVCGNISYRKEQTNRTSISDAAIYSCTCAGIACQEGAK